MAEKIEGPARELLEAPNFSYVGTVRSDGSVQVVPTWVTLDGDLVVLNSAEGRSWPENARRTGKLTITVPDKDNPYHYVSIRGRIVEDTHEGADENIDDLAEQYMGQRPYPLRQPGEQRIMFKVEPERVMHFGGG